MKTSSLNPENNRNAIPSAAAFKEFHALIPLEGNPPNDLLTIPDDLFLYLAAAIRNEPISPPMIAVGEWHIFLSHLPSHGILPLIAWHLRSWPEDCRPPGEIMAFLSRVLVSGGARSLRLGRQIQVLTRALEEAKIPVLLLKGPALARTVYPDPALRHSSDIDLLVKPEDVLKCEPVFSQLGYTCPEHTFHFAAQDRHHQVFFPSGNGSHVELHWVADSSFHMFSPGWLKNAFDRKIQVTAEDLSFYTLHPVDHLTILAHHHVFMHQSLRLDWIYDIALLKDTLTANDWADIRSSCVSNHIRIPLELALKVSVLWGTNDIPEEYRNFSTWPSVSVREQKLWKHAVTRQTSIHSAIYLKLQGLTTTREKLRVCWRYIIPPREFLQHFRKSESCIDIPLAYIRQLLRFSHNK